MSNHDPRTNRVLEPQARAWIATIVAIIATLVFSPDAVDAHAELVRADPPIDGYGRVQSCIDTEVDTFELTTCRCCAWPLLVIA